MKKDKIVGSLMLIACSLIWGLTFVAQSKGAEHIPPMLFTCIRNFMAVIVLLPVIAVLDRRRKRTAGFSKTSPTEKRSLFAGSVICGASLCVAAYLQQLGITMGTPSGKAGFITALYIILTPIASIFLRKRPSPIIWFCVPLSIVGLYLLCVKDGLTVLPSDLIVLGCAAVFTVQILAVDSFSHKCEGVKLAAGQFFFCAVFALMFALAFEKISFSNIKAGLLPLLYAGIFASGVAYTFQITGQKRLENPTIASMIMSMESVFGVLSSSVILHQKLSGREILGCVLMFSAIIIAQLPIDIFKRRQRNVRA